MGDSCYNPGMQSITQQVGATLGTYAICVPTGNRLTDTTNGFLMTMDRNVDIFASNIRQDPQLKAGFNCIGFSQGNMLCRGYICPSRRQRTSHPTSRPVASACVGR